MFCLVNDAVFFIGLISMPFQNEKIFYDNEIDGEEGLFRTYKDAIKKQFTKNGNENYITEFNEFFYKPKAYYLFGKFDLAIIALVDDFEMCCRTFHPFAPMTKIGDKPYFENFIHKMIVGPTPKFTTEDSVVELAQKTFLSKDPKPLFAISLLKLNNCLLIGSGTDFLRSVIKYVRYKAKELLNSETEIIILESFSWHEITILFFTDSYQNVGQFLLNIRESSFGDLITAFTDHEKTKFFDNFDKCSPLISELKSHKNGDFDINAAHLFENSETNFGFDFEIFDELDPSNKATPFLFEKIDKFDEVFVNCRHFIKPGHIKKAINVLNCKDKDKARISIGRGDYSFPEYKEKSHLTKQMIKNILKPFGNKELKYHIIQSYTIPEIECSLKGLKKISPDHFYFSEHLRSLQFGVEDISAVQNKLRALGIPKILTAKILNIFSNFNDGILDRSLYIFFLELRPFIKSIKETINMYYLKKGESYNIKVFMDNILEPMTDSFERAYRNRFHNSYRMGEITDFNIEFKGGIQQLVTCFDSAYKAICSKLGNPHSFAFVSGDAGVHSTEWAICLNYFHIFQPERFISIATHESANFLLTKQFKDWDLDFAVYADLQSLYKPHHKINGKLAKKLLELKMSFKYPNVILLDIITPKFLHQCFADIISYYFSYNMNSTIFSYWYWSNFIQLPNAYIKPKVVDEAEFVSSLMRLLIIFRTVDKDYFEAYSLPFDSILNSIMQKWYKKIKIFIDLLFKDKQISTWFQQTHSFVQDIFIALYKDMIHEFSLEREVKINKIRKITDGKADIFRDKIENGEVCRYERECDDSRFQFTQLIFYTYLKFLKERFLIRNSFLNRDSEGKVSVKNNDSLSDILFDPLGGIFTHDPLVRRELIKYRTSVIMSLWDMGIKEKKYVILSKMNK